ncbi:DUF1186 domain-containing protein [Anaerobaca lacustris]|uniref:DUF1186 domain-containing protein n=1 Tax=Anaerobaca lacustris TaxID=3044600 RepID=A0AAW6U6X9_9BACT|nr:DUF1186 domain-containing protein [Sedimentisphaerales bacterium M17dextr]
MTDSRVAEILKAFEVYDGVYKRAEVDAAAECREEITPHLIGILEEVLTDPASYAAKEGYQAHVYALVLLTHFREQRAHRAIVALASLPPPLPDELLGDIITEHLPVFLLRTSGGSMTGIKSLIMNPKADEYCRTSAVRALAYAVADGIMRREEALAFLSSLFAGDEADSDSGFWGCVACSICDLYPEELMGVIEKAYQDELILSGIIGLDSFERTLRDGKEATLKRLRDDLALRSPENVHDYMSWWACFQQQKPVSREPASRGVKASRPQQDERKARRQRRKRERKRRGR